MLEFLAYVAGGCVEFQILKLLNSIISEFSIPFLPKFLPDNFHASEFHKFPASQSQEYLFKIILVYVMCMDKLSVKCPSMIKHNIENI